MKQNSKNDEAWLGICVKLWYHDLKSRLYATVLKPGVLMRLNSKTISSQENFPRKKKKTIFSIKEKRELSDGSV